jgi:hypothetical protein
MENQVTTSSQASAPKTFNGVEAIPCPKVKRACRAANTQSRNAPELFQTLRGEASKVKQAANIQKLKRAAHVRAHVNAVDFGKKSHASKQHGGRKL